MIVFAPNFPKNSNYMVQPSASYMVRIQNPVFQASLVLSAILLVDVSAKFLQSAGIGIEQRFPWTVTASFILFFAVFNSVISLLSNNLDSYWTRSILSYVGLAGLAGLAAYLFSSLGINEAGSYRWLYIVLTFGYLLFMSIIGLMRKIVEFAQREEWNQPRLRKKKK
jgi:hypothetical protein